MPRLASPSPRLTLASPRLAFLHPCLPELSVRTGSSLALWQSLLKRQLVEPVRWEQAMEEATKPFHNHTAYIETGPGKQLKAMMRRIDQEAWGKMTVLE